MDEFEDEEASFDDQSEGSVDQGSFSDAEFFDALDSV